MLADSKLKAFLPTINAEKALDFYQNILGLQLLSQDNYAIEFKANGTHLRITTVQTFTPHPFTVLGWDVTDIVASVQLLNNKGVQFEKYDFITQDDLGIWTAPGNSKVAWFKDPDGNLLSLSQLNRE